MVATVVRFLYNISLSTYQNDLPESVRMLIGIVSVFQSRRQKPKRGMTLSIHLSIFAAAEPHVRRLFFTMEYVRCIQYYIVSIGIAFSITNNFEFSSSNMDYPSFSIVNGCNTPTRAFLRRCFSIIYYGKHTSIELKITYRVYLES